MTKKLILAVFVAALAFTSCHKDPTPAPTPDPEPQTVTRLARENIITTYTSITTQATADYTWENGNLMRVCDTVSMPIATVTTQERMVYEDGKIVRIEEENGKWEHYFTYENGQIVSFLTLRNGDTTVWGNASYNGDGLVEQILCHADSKTTKWSLTWEDGDAVQLIEDIIEPADLAGTHVYNYTYDNSPCVYTGFPMAYSIYDGEGVHVATRQSKHNRIREGYTYSYDDNGLLISAAAESDSVYYHYIEQVVE